MDIRENVYVWGWTKVQREEVIKATYLMELPPWLATCSGNSADKTLFLQLYLRIAWPYRLRYA